MMGGVRSGTAARGSGYEGEGSAESPNDGSSDGEASQKFGPRTQACQLEEVGDGVEPWGRRKRSWHGR